jgi:hypothetical protein
VGRPATRGHARERRPALWPAARSTLELAQRCRKLSPSFVPPATFTAELAAYAREVGRHRLADDLAELAAPNRPAAP